MLFVPSGLPTDVPVNEGTEDGLLKLELVPSAAPTAVPVNPGEVEGAARLAFGAAADELPARTPELPAVAPMLVFGPAPVAVEVVRPTVVLGPAPVVAGVVIEPTLPLGPAPVAVVTLAAEAGVSVAGRGADALAALGRARGRVAARRDARHPDIGGDPARGRSTDRGADDLVISGRSPAARHGAGRRDLRFGVPSGDRERERGREHETTSGCGNHTSLARNPCSARVSGRAQTDDVSSKDAGARGGRCASRGRYREERRVSDRAIEWQNRLRSMQNASSSRFGRGGIWG